MWGILGGGFGLYGYLPALLALGQREVALPVRYRPTLMARAELAPLMDRVRFVDDEAALLDVVDSLVIAQRPADTLPRLAEALARPGVRRLVIEKPLAPTPAAAAELLASIERHGARCAAGFTFRWAPWAAAWRRALLAAEPGTVGFVRWHFEAHHHRFPERTTWKRHVPDGGGVLRFYGIHLIALLAEWGYTAADHSLVCGDPPWQASSWRARFTGAGLAPVQVEVRTDVPVSRFVVGVGGEAARTVHRGSDPFDQPAVAVAAAALPAAMDRRCGYLQALLQETPDERVQTRLHAATRLWAAAERATAFVPLLPEDLDLEACVP